MKKYKIAILSTYFENAGDDLIRSGIEEILDKNLKSYKIIHFSKSNELSLYADLSYLTHSPRWQKSKLQKRIHDGILRRIPEWLKQKLYKSRLLRADVLIIAGTPLFYFTHRKFTFLKNGFWSKKVIEAYSNTGKPVFVVGSGFILDDSPTEIALRFPDEIAFLQKLIQRASYFSVRDSISENFLKTTIPHQSFITGHCPSLWNSPPHRQVIPKKVLLSYSIESARIDENTVEAIAKREKVFGRIVNYLIDKGFDISLISHNQVDFVTQSTIYQKYNLQPPLLLGYDNMLNQFASAEFVITWRVHGGMAARLCGVPTLLFKTDNRYKMAADIGAQILDDRELSEDEIINELQVFLENSINHTNNALPDLRNEIKTFSEILSNQLAK